MATQTALPEAVLLALYLDQAAPKTLRTLTAYVRDLIEDAPITGVQVRRQLDRFTKEGRCCWFQMPTSATLIWYIRGPWAAWVRNDWHMSDGESG